MALKDFAKAKRQPNFEPSMGTWLAQDAGVCYGCLAGSILFMNGARTLAEWLTLPAKDRRYCEAIDCLRHGGVEGAWLRLDKPYPKPKTEDRAIRGYHSDPRGFYKDMIQLIKDLRSNGE